MSLNEEIKKIEADERVKELMSKPSDANHIIRTLLQELYLLKKEDKRYERAITALREYINVVDYFPSEYQGEQKIDRQEIDLYEHIKSLKTKKDHISS